MCQWVILRQNQSPEIPFRKFDVFILSAVRLLGQYQKIKQSLIQFVDDLFRITAGDVIVQIRVAFLEVFDDSREIFYLTGLCHPEIQLTAVDIVQGHEFLFNFIGQVYQILCAVP